MNLHISKEEHLFLQKHVIDSILIGSRMYGTTHTNSDTDILCVYEYPPEWSKHVESLNSFPNVTQLQYKCEESNTDYIYTDPIQFVKNQRSGDSAINSDVILFTNAVVPTEKEKLELTYTYKVIKAYLGFAKRDIKQYGEGMHKLRHAARGLYIAQCLLSKDLPKLEDIRKLHIAEMASICDLIDIEKAIRNDLNKALGAGEINMYFVPTVEDPLLNKIIQSNNIREFKY